MPAQLHPGSVVLSMDHSVITLRDAGGLETAMISLYDISFSATLGRGRLALVRVPSLGVEAMLTERLELGRRMQARLKGMGMAYPLLDSPPVEASFERGAWIEDGFGYSIRAPGLTVLARWGALDPPFFALGPAPAFSPAEDIWSVFVGARQASISVNGSIVPGEPFDDDVWVPKLGRSLSSAHSALGETRVTPPR